MNLRTLCGSAALLLILPGVGMAQFNYTSAEFNYVFDVEVDDSSLDGDGLSIGGTFTIAESFYLGGSYDDYDLEAGWDGELLELGGGYFHSLDDDLDFVATFSFVDAEVSNRNFSFDDDGFKIGGGVRAKLADTVEVDAMLEYINMDEGDSDTGVALRGRYYVNDGFAFQAKATFGTDFEIISIGVRGEF
jgi:hypothetical protein